MKTPPVLLCAVVLTAIVFHPSCVRAEDTGKSTSDKAREALNKIADELQKAASKTEKKGKELWEHTKENFRFGKEEYLSKSGAALSTMNAEVQALAEADTGVAGRDYFKTRLESLKQQVEYCKRDWNRLKELPDEDSFRVKQKGFDRTLGFLSDNIGLAKDEAGL